ncbi:hypothetical protein [Nocardia carnea]|uniref:Uncharacterized protein n=1 Tax=Nocardia carnea TaxID=37328 RepID=A0ABW7TKY0_9NOCA|nr:hypothetical protein [Nocardia carnea]
MPADEPDTTVVPCPEHLGELARTQHRGLGAGSGPPFDRLST